jgi:hypothetical protein
MLAQSTTETETAEQIEYILLNQHAAKSQLLSTYSRVLAIATSFLSSSLL